MNNQLNAARMLRVNLGLGPEMEPVSRFGERASHGKVFLTKGGKLMKISGWTKNSERELKIAKRASNTNVGPRVYNTRSWTPQTANHGAILKALAPNSNKLAVITMDKVPNAVSVYNAINKGWFKRTNWHIIDNAVRKMHSAGIHHGNLHGGNLLAYKNNSGKIKVIAIDFGASKYSNKIKNNNSAVKQSVCRGMWRSKQFVNECGLRHYLRPGRNQTVRSNIRMLEYLHKYFIQGTSY